jgi:hypothetical protein
MTRSRSEKSVDTKRSNSHQRSCTKHGKSQVRKNSLSASMEGKKNTSKGDQL